MDAALIPGAPTPALAHWAAWTVMATQLTELCSRLLLPADTAAAQPARVEAETTRRRWLRHAELMAAADWLDRQPQLGHEVFARGRPAPAGTAHADRRHPAVADDAAADERDEGEAGGDDLTALLRACLVALRLPAHVEAYQPRRLQFWSVGDAAARSQRMLQGLPAGATLDAFLPELSSTTRSRRCAAAPPWPPP